MAHGDAREGKWRGNWRMKWVASTFHTISENCVSSITTADAQTSAASSRLNWRPRRFKWTRPFRRKTKNGFCACAITFQNAVYHNQYRLHNNVTVTTWCTPWPCSYSNHRTKSHPWKVNATTNFTYNILTLTHLALQRFRNMDTVWTTGTFIHLVVWLTTGPKPLPKQALHIVRSRASSFKWEYPLLSLRSSNSFLRLLPCLPVTSIPLLSFLQ